MSPPTNVGSEKDKINSGKVLSDKERNIFQSLCGNTDGIVGAFECDETKCDDDEMSDSESVFGEEIHFEVEVNEGEEDNAVMWKSLTEKELESNITDGLKKIGNVKKKPMSDLVLEDLLGSYGDKKLEKVVENRLKVLKRRQRQLDMIDKANRWYESRKERMRCYLDEKRSNSRNDTWVRRDYVWKGELDAMMNEAGGGDVTVETPPIAPVPLSNIDPERRLIISKVCNDVFAIPSLRDWQVEAIHHLCWARPELTFIQRAPADGKSLVIMAHAFMTRGFLLVIVPLLGLGCDQVDKARLDEHNIEAYHLDEHR